MEKIAHSLGFDFMHIIDLLAFLDALLFCGRRRSWLEFKLSPSGLWRLKLWMLESLNGGESLYMPVVKTTLGENNFRGY
ncbi:hypothetical protein LIER_29388 [Lithospermum erythrorhizon]|uniref:Uncharacterized protein n=1 Tax=Lithospermum erythrorhizon TaxID=34254 RepID=A0AAV3RIY5_LITER